jgi:hypothetical protein
MSNYVYARYVHALLRMRLETPTERLFSIKNATQLELREFATGTAQRSRFWLLPASLSSLLTQRRLSQAAAVTPPPCAASTPRHCLVMIEVEDTTYLLWKRCSLAPSHWNKA